MTASTSRRATPFAAAAPRPGVIVPEHPFSPAQGRSFAWSSRRFCLWEGSARAGKSFVAFLRFVAALADYRGAGQHVIVGKSRDTVYRNVFLPIESEPGLAFLRPLVTYRQGATTARILGIPVSVLGANDEGAESKIRGMTVAKALGDEVSTWPASFFRQLTLRMSPAGAQAFLTTNPDNPRHWLKTDYIDPWKAGELVDWTVFHQTMDDNPGLSPEYRASVEASLHGLWFKRYVLGLWVAAEGAIYDEWSEQSHVVPWSQLPPIDRYLGIGLDYGTTNPSSAVLLGITAERDDLGRPTPRLVAVDEWRWDPAVEQLRLAPSVQSERFRAWLRRPHSPTDVELDRRGLEPLEIPYVFRDPAAADFGEQLRADGLSAWLAANDVAVGIADVANLLHTRRLLVAKPEPAAPGLPIAKDAPGCAGVISEAPAYAWNPKATKKGNDEPLKENDHSLDALRYALRSTKTSWAAELRRAYGAASVLAA